MSETRVVYGFVRVSTDPQATPYGFVVDTDGSTLLPNPDEQHVINLVLELRTSGLSMRRIAAELVRKQLPNKTGRVRWNQTQVHKMLAKHPGLLKATFAERYLK